MPGKKKLFLTILKELSNNLDFVSSSAFEIYNIIKSINVR